MLLKFLFWLQDIVSSFLAWLTKKSVICAKWYRRGYKHDIDVLTDAKQTVIEKADKQIGNLQNKVALLTEYIDGHEKRSGAVKCSTSILRRMGS